MQNRRREVEAAGLEKCKSSKVQSCRVVEQERGVVDRTLLRALGSDGAGNSWLPARIQPQRPGMTKQGCEKNEAAQSSADAYRLMDERSE